MTENNKKDQTIKKPFYYEMIPYGKYFNINLCKTMENEDINILNDILTEEEQVRLNNYLRNLNSQNQYSKKAHFSFVCMLMDFSEVPK